MFVSPLSRSCIQMSGSGIDSFIGFVMWTSDSSTAGNTGAGSVSGCNGSVGSSGKGGKDKGTDESHAVVFTLAGPAICYLGGQNGVSVIMKIPDG